MSELSALETAATLCQRYLEDLDALRGYPTLEQCELLLCAYDLGLSGPQVATAVQKLAAEEEASARATDGLFHQLARQLVLARFDAAAPLRTSFLQEWVVSERFRSIADVATTAFLMTLALEQDDLLPIEWQGYAAQWFLRRTRFRSERFEAWACYCLSFGGQIQEASTRAQALLNTRELNGSWANDLPRTIGCLHGLAASHCVDREELQPTARWISVRIATGFARDLTTRTQALKALHLQGSLPMANAESLRARVRCRSSISLSHSGADKDFVRRLASDLTKQGVRVWFDEAELLPGDSLFGKIEQAIGDMQFLAIVLSPKAVKSPWVTEELRMGQIRAIESREVVVVPILAKPCAVPLSLRDKVWCDFSVDHDKGLQFLLRRVAPWAVS